MNTKDVLDKFDVKSYEGIFFGYYSISKAYRVFIKLTLAIEEHVKESNKFVKNIIDTQIEIASGELKNISIKNT